MITANPAILSSDSEAAQKGQQTLLVSAPLRIVSERDAMLCGQPARQLLSADAGKRLIPVTSFGTIGGEHRRGIEGVVMQKSLLAISAAAVSAVLLSTAPAYSQPYAFGDTPYTNARGGPAHSRSSVSPESFRLSLMK